MCAQSAGVRCLCKKEAHVGVAQTCVCTYMWGCVCVCRCLSVCVCVQVTQSLAKARTTVNKHAEIETSTALWIWTPPSPPLCRSTSRHSRSVSALQDNFGACQRCPLPASQRFCAFECPARVPVSHSLSLSLSCFLSLSPCLSVFVCVRVACSQALISTTAKRLSFDLTVTSLSASARLCFIQLPTACKCNFN